MSCLRILLWAACCVVIATVAPVCAAKADLTDVAMQQLEDGKWLAKAKATDIFTPYVNNAMLAGITIEIRVDISVGDEKGSFRKNLLADLNYLHTVSYDNITSQYTVKVWRGEKDLTFLETDFFKVRDLASTFERTLTLPPEKLRLVAKPGLRMKVTLDPQVPSWTIDDLLFFLRRPIVTPWRGTSFSPIIPGVTQPSRE